MGTVSFKYPRVGSVGRRGRGCGVGVGYLLTLTLSTSSLTTRSTIVQISTNGIRGGVAPCLCKTYVRSMGRRVCNNLCSRGVFNRDFRRPISVSGFVKFAHYRKI